MSNKPNRGSYKKVELSDQLCVELAQEARVAVENFKFSSDKERIHGLTASTIMFGIVEKFMKKNGLNEYFAEVLKAETTKVLQKYHTIFARPQTLEDNLHDYEPLKLSFHCGCEIVGAITYHKQCETAYKNVNDCGYYRVSTDENQLKMESIIGESDLVEERENEIGDTVELVIRETNFVDDKVHFWFQDNYQKEYQEWCTIKQFYEVIGLCGNFDYILQKGLFRMNTIWKVEYPKNILMEVRAWHSQ